MSRTIWITSDTHFGHRKMVDTFKREDGRYVRHEFASVEDMDEALVERWNSRVKPTDKVYHLGDVSMSRKTVERMMPKLNGHKRLIRGNHDLEDTAFYLQFFEELHATRVMDHIVFTHVPVAPWALERWRGNAHGHVHANLPLLYRANMLGTLLPGPIHPQKFVGLYVNVSSEQTGYAPVTLEDISALLPRHEHYVRHGAVEDR